MTNTVKQSKKSEDYSKFTPAEWVPPNEAAFALHQYKDLYEKITQIEQDDRKVDSMYIQHKAIKAFCTDEAIEDFWKRLENKGSLKEIKEEDKYNGREAINLFTSMFWGYNFKPSITKSEKNDDLKAIDEALKDICVSISADVSVHMHMNKIFGVTLLEELKVPSDTNPKELKKLSCINHRNAYSFFKKLRENIATSEIDPHSRWAFNLKKKNEAERVFFMLEVYKLVEFAYSHHEIRKSNYAMTARILNVILPDLGNFSEGSVRAAVNKRKNA